MEGLCEGGNESPSSLKASHLNAIDLARDRTRNLGHRRPALYKLANQVDSFDDKRRRGNPRIPLAKKHSFEDLDEGFFLVTKTFRTTQRFTQLPIKLTTASSSLGIKDGRSVVPTIPSQSSIYSHEA
ncbi:hypothetical protein ANN_06828 [Periplaneta americana]|uniref:Uncharacterized protein n=1 Tax=Periplaneta americana TaxID=6978 RepID=A0ABQ8TER1_PERAM|nr:hypothetical protein ANN_06828 [Periplaneta americana]